METLRAFAWRAGTVGLAFVLAVALTLGTSTSSTKTAEAAACTITITEADSVRTVLSSADTGAGSATAAVDTVVPKTIFGFYSRITGGLAADLFGAALERMQITNFASDTSIAITRGIQGTTAVQLDDNDALAGKVVTDNGAECIATAGTALTITLKSAYDNYSAEVYVEETIDTGLVVTVNGAVTTTTETTITYDGAGAAGVEVGDTLLIGTENVFVTADTGTVVTVIRGYNGTTAATHADNASITLAESRDATFAGRQPVTPTINGKSSVNTYAEARTVGLTTYTSGATSSSAQYSGTFTVNSTVPGRAVIAVVGPNAGFMYGATAAASENLINVIFRGAPVDYVDNNADGRYVAADDTDRSSVTAPASVAADTASTCTSTNDDVLFDFEDKEGEELVGTATLTLSDAAFAAGAKFANSGKQDISVTTNTSGDNTVNITGLPCTGNFRYTYTLEYVGTTGSLSLSSNAHVFRTNNKTSTLTATLKKAATAGSVDSVKDTVKTSFPAVTAGDADLYYIEVVAKDDAGNPVGDTIKVKDNDGDGTEGVGSDITFEAYDGTAGGAAVTSLTASSGKARFAVRSAAVRATGVVGSYDLTFYRSADATKSVDITVGVESAASAYTLAASSGQNADGSLNTGSVGTWLVTAKDANGNKISAAPTVTFVVTGLGTGATAGKSIPTSGSLSVSATLGATLSVVAPTVAGSGTIAVINSSGKIVASTTVSFVGNASGATVSGTGCTGSAEGAYTCVVTDGGTAAEVATASGAASVWQSDADGVLQGYVVGTPDFVDTGLASTADIASNSAVIVVR